MSSHSRHVRSIWHTFGCVPQHVTFSRFEGFYEIRFGDRVLVARPRDTNALRWDHGKAGLVGLHGRLGHPLAGQKVGPIA